MSVVITLADIEAMPPGRSDGVLRWRHYRLRMRGQHARTCWAAPLAGPVTVRGRRGIWELPEEWEGYLAADPQGYPAAIEAEDFERVWEPVPPEAPFFVVAQ
jgi:hypothetical protein